MNIIKFQLLVLLVVIFESCTRNVYAPVEELQSPLIKKGDFSFAFSPVISNYIYANSSLSYSPIKNFGIGISSFGNDFYRKQTASIGYYYTRLIPKNENKFLYEGFVFDTWFHASKSKLKDGNIEEGILNNDYGDLYDAEIRNYKIDLGLHYFYPYVQLTFRPKLSMIDITKIYTRTADISPSLDYLIKNDPYTLIETTFKISFGNTRTGIFIGSNVLFGNVTNTYFERLNIFAGGRITISDYF